MIRGVLAVVVIVIVARALHVRRQRRERAVIDAAIGRNQYRYRPGMRQIDEAMRDRSTARRRAREEQLDAFKREIQNDRPRLHRAS